MEGVVGLHQAASGRQDGQLERSRDANLSQKGLQGRGQAKRDRTVSIQLSWTVVSVCVCVCVCVCGGTGKVKNATEHANPVYIHSETDFY